MANRKVIAIIETEIDERLCRLELNREKTMYKNNTEYNAFFGDDEEALEDISHEIENRLNYTILRVEDKLCGNVMWVE